MTCIAWDGKTLAADKRFTSCGLPSATTKIFRVNDELVGFAGQAAQAMEMLDWFYSEDPELFPESQRDADDAVDMLVVRHDGRLELFSRTPFPMRIEEPRYAIGSGRDFALVAMHLGKSASEAVEIATLFDIQCGNGVDELTL